MSLSPVSQMASTYRRVETQMAGNIENDVRRNMRIEIVSAVLYGVCYSALLFLPAVLTRMGAPPSEISLYLSLSYLGHITSSFSLLFVRRFKPLTFATASWVAG